MQDLAGLAMQVLVEDYTRALVVDFMVGLAVGFTLDLGEDYTGALGAACTAVQEEGYMQGLGVDFMPAQGVVFMLAHPQMIKMHIVVLGDHVLQEQQKTTGLGQIVPIGGKDKENFQWKTQTRPRNLISRLTLKI
jgi:hypothetical protein